MQELEKIRRVIGKHIEEAPHEVLLVLDATAGQNAISQARGFSDAAGCTGIVLAKIDGSAKGGVIVPIRQQFDLPVKFVGTGESMDDMTRFDSGVCKRSAGRRIERSGRQSHPFLSVLRSLIVDNRRLYNPYSFTDR